MRKLLLGAGFAALALGACPVLTTPAGAVGVTPAMAGQVARDDALVERVRGRGHAHGHRHVRGDRGLHRGWSRGRGNPHRFR